MSDFFTKKQKKYWCEICRIFIEFNQKAIEHHNATTMHKHNMVRPGKYFAAKKRFREYINDLKEKDEFTDINNNNSNDNNLLGMKRKQQIEQQKKDNTSLFNKIKMEMITKEINKEEGKDKKSWKVFYDKKRKKVFYFNFLSGESQWEKPEGVDIDDNEVKEVVKKIKEEDKKHREGNAGPWEKCDRKTMNKIFGRRRIDFNEQQDNEGDDDEDDDKNDNKEEKKDK